MLLLDVSLCCLSGQDPAALEAEPPEPDRAPLVEIEEDKVGTDLQQSVSHVAMTQSK